MNTTHKIIAMERGETKGSGSPMWRCSCENGDRVNAFQHADPKKDSMHLFDAAGYADIMTLLRPREVITWKKFPIDVELEKSADDKWWNIVAVAPRPTDSCPDPDFVPPYDYYRTKARAWAQMMQNDWLNTVYFDTETTGISDDDEIISFSALARFGDIPLFHSLIRPVNMDRVENAQHVHGITPERLANAPTFPEIYPRLFETLSGLIWIIYNAPFDTRMLEQDCLRHNLPPIINVGVNDAMTYFAQYHGEWNAAYREFTSKKLEFAAEEI
jgi:hypothetical protein